jgi:hypothetical protein
MSKEMEGDEDQRRAAARAAHRAGEEPSALGVTTGASKQWHHLRRFESCRGQPAGALLLTSGFAPTAPRLPARSLTVSNRASGLRTSHKAKLGPLAGLPDRSRAPSIVARSSSEVSRDQDAARYAPCYGSSVSACVCRGLTARKCR